jgi:hypothetical protein
MLVEVELAITRDITDLTLERIFFGPSAKGRLRFVLTAL